MPSALSTTPWLTTMAGPRSALPRRSRPRHVFQDEGRDQREHAAHRRHDAEAPRAEMPKLSEADLADHAPSIFEVVAPSTSDRASRSDRRNEDYRGVESRRRDGEISCPRPAAEQP